jgi:hypothetical protein
MTGQFLRTMTLTGIVDEAWGQDAIDEIENIAKKGHEGDTPEQPPFAKHKVFWMMAANAAVMGVLLGLAGIVFINIIDEVPKVWSDVDTHGGYDFEEEENVGFNDGKVMYTTSATVAVTVAVAVVAVVVTITVLACVVILTHMVCFVCLSVCYDLTVVLGLRDDRCRVPCGLSALPDEVPGEPARLLQGGDGLPRGPHLGSPHGAAVRHIAGGRSEPWS